MENLRCLRHWECGTFAVERCRQAPRGAEERGDRLCVLQVAKLKGEGLPKSSRARRCHHEPWMLGVSVELTIKRLL